MTNQNALYDFAYYYIDDVSVIKLPDQDISLDSITHTSNCYSDSSSLQLRFQNTATKALDFTVDTVSFSTEVKVNGMLVQTLLTELSDNLKNPTPNTPLQPDSFMTVEIFPVNLSRLGDVHEISIVASFERDEDSSNNKKTMEITPILDVGDISVSPNPICPGGVVKLQTKNYIGELLWQYSLDAQNWSDLPRNATAYQQVFESTYYRLNICAFLLSDSVLVEVLPVPVLQSFSDTICGGANFKLEPELPAVMDDLHWFYDSSDTSPFHIGLTYSSYFENSHTFYVQAQKDSCLSPFKSTVQLIVENCPLQVPNVFTPNEDGLNDIFYFHNAGNKKLHTKIFNRWGTEVASWEGNIGWDAKGLSDGVYYYIVEEKVGEGTIVHKGKVTILR